MVMLMQPQSEPEPQTQEYHFSVDGPDVEVLSIGINRRDENGLLEEISELRW
jgi:hypothetical protein